jgi:hypothetical protein
MTNTGPLTGITVVALEQAVSAPMCTRVLADFGARVIKVENPNGGDFARHYDDVVNGLAAHFVWANRGKESVTLNLKTEAGLDILRRLLDRADVLVSNLAPGSTGRLGIAAADLAERHRCRNRRVRPWWAALPQKGLRPACSSGIWRMRRDRQSRRTGQTRPADGRHQHRVVFGAIDIGSAVFP